MLNYFHVCLILETDRNFAMFGMKLFSKNVNKESAMSINLYLVIKLLKDFIIIRG